MATPYSQLDQRGRSAYGLSVSAARLKRVADKVRAQRFMDQAVEIVHRETVNLIGRCEHVSCTLHVELEPEDFKPLTFAEAEVKIRGLEFTPLENVKTVQVPVGASEESIAEAILADAAPAPRDDKAFCIEWELEDGWRRFPGHLVATVDRARDLESKAKELAQVHPGIKFRIIRTDPGAERAVMRFRYIRGKGLGSY